MYFQLCCSQCGKELKSAKARIRHELGCKRYQWQCKSCDTFLSTKQSRNNHEVSCQTKTTKRKEHQLQQQQQQQQQESANSPTNPALNPPRAVPDSTCRYVCGVCDKGFKTLKPFLKHREMHYHRTLATFTCRVCQQQFPTRQELANHFSKHPSGSGLAPMNSKKEEKKKGTDSKNKKLKCHNCDKTFDRWHQLLSHRAITHGSTHPGTQQQQLPHQQEPEQHSQDDVSEKEPSSRIPWKADPTIKPPWYRIDDEGRETVDTDLKAVYDEYEKTINAEHDQGKVRAVYNFPVNDFDGNSEDLFDHLQTVFSNEDMSFRINLAFGVILQNVETEEYRYYTPYYNSTLLDHPARINNRSDLIALFRRLERMDLLDLVLKTKESTKWRKVFITNINYYIYRTAFPIGALGGVVLPDYIRQKRSIIGFQNTRNNEPYRDNLCLFRCLTYAQRGERGANFENIVTGRYTVWREFLAAQGRTDLPPNAKRYKGVFFTDLPDFEECFNVRITVYSLQRDHLCTRLYVSSVDIQTEAATELNLNLYENHFSLIKHFDAYAHKYACGFCGRAFDRVDLLKKHTSVCDSRIKYTFPGGLYTPQVTIFEEMQSTLGIQVEERLQFFPWFCVYDFEAVLKKIPQHREGQDGTRYITEHIPICVSISSNVPGFESPHCIIESDPDDLVKRMCDYMHEIQTVTATLASDRWKHVFEQLETLKDMFPVEDENEASRDANGGTDNAGHSNMRAEETERDPETVQKLHAKRVMSITDKFKKYAAVLPALGFNSSRYDLNLIKKYFPKHLNLATEADYIIKKNNEYSAIATSKFKFLDISNYLAAGCSYSKFLKAYGVSESKSYFPYEWFDDVSKLDFQSLPAYEDFKSSLRNANVLEVEHTHWLECGSVGEQPKTGREKYQDLLTIWEEKG